jgi:predicted extracellular nuclease
MICKNTTSLFLALYSTIKKSLRMKLNLLLFAIVCAILWSCNPTNNTSNQNPTSNKEVTSDSDENAVGGDREAIRIAFYNVENLFDIKDNPKKPDDEFTPNGRNKWDLERYNKKLNQLGKVIKAMDTPAFIGVCEVENRDVLVDLVANNNLSARSYGIAHKESNDYRGIDVALLYDKNRFEVEDIKNTILKFPRSVTGQDDYTSRDLFHVKGKLDGKEMLHIFVNHWPSRRGGLKESEPKRMFVAKQLRKQIDNLLNDDANAKIIIMGDFNDETDNNSIKKGLKVVANDSDKSGELVNCFTRQDDNQEGSYRYRGNWNMLDQIILSDNFFAKNSSLQFEESAILKKDWMLYKDKKYGATPNKTYGGPNYYGGYSDHLPVYVDIEVK